MPYYRNRRYDGYDNAEINRLPSGLFFTASRVKHNEPPPNIPRDYVEQKEVINHDEINYADFVVPEYNSTKNGKEIYLPLLEVSVEVEVVATIAWSKLTQTFTNRSKKPIKEATYCMPLYDKSTVTEFVCTIGSDKILKGTVKPKEKAKAEYKEAVAKQQVAALLEEHTPEVFETSVGNIPAETTVKVEISYITELKADLGGDGVLVTIPTSVAPRYGAMPSLMGGSTEKSLAVPEKNGLQIKIQVSSPVAITKIESRTHPVSIEMGSHGTRVTKDIRDFSKKHEPQGFDPQKAAATLSDRNACLGRDFVLLIQAKDGRLLASRAITEPHPTKPNSSALMVSINLRDLYTPNVVSSETASEIIFVADRSFSMEESMEALKTAMKFFLKSLPNNCIFNICSFGTKHKLMWDKSRHYNQENVDIALDYVTTHFSADMGGTEIRKALRHVVKKSDISAKTNIITLTDGEIWDADELFDFIESSTSTYTRFFCLGIGEDVSHSLVEGIGRYGGGLAEVVATDSSGDWIQSVIGMLRAALTPSSWTFDVTLDGVSISAEESENKRCIQAPHQIPNLHAFSRSSVYFLLDQEFEGKVVKINATSVESGEAFTAEIPIEKSHIRKKWVHQLAAKAVLGDLETGRSWIHEKDKIGADSKTKAEVDEMVKIEGEKLGIEWNISSKWTSFIVVDEKSLQEKQSRWYQPENSDLADLTRPRYEPKYQHAYQGAYMQSPPQGRSLQQSTTDPYAGDWNTQGIIPFPAGNDSSEILDTCQNKKALRSWSSQPRYRSSRWSAKRRVEPSSATSDPVSMALDEPLGLTAFDRTSNSDEEIINVAVSRGAGSNSQQAPQTEQSSKAPRLWGPNATDLHSTVSTAIDEQLVVIDQHQQGRYSDHDNDFVATIAAGFASAGFDANMMANDPRYRRRDSIQATSQDIVSSDDPKNESPQMRFSGDHERSPSFTYVYKRSHRRSRSPSSESDSSDAGLQRRHGARLRPRLSFIDPDVAVRSVDDCYVLAVESSSTNHSHEACTHAFRGRSPPSSPINASEAQPRLASSPRPSLDSMEIGAPSGFSSDDGYDSSAAYSFASHRPQTHTRSRRRSTSPSAGRLYDEARPKAYPKPRPSPPPTVDPRLRSGARSSSPPPSRHSRRSARRSPSPHSLSPLHRSQTEVVRPAKPSHDSPIKTEHYEMQYPSRPLHQQEHLLDNTWGTRRRRLAMPMMPVLNQNQRMPSTDVSYIPSNSQQQGRQSPFRPSDDNEELQATLSEEEQWLHQPRSQREPIAPTLTLSSLLATHKIAGYFDLPPPLRKLLNAKYAITARAEIDSIYEPPSSSRRAWRARRISVLDTAMVVVYIEVVYWAEKRLWDLVLQKARAWLEAEIPDPEIRKRGLERARELLIPDGTDETGEEAGDGQESVLPGEFWHDDSLEPGVDGGGKGEERVNSEAWFGEGWQAVTGTMAASDAKTPHPLTNEPEAGKRALPSV